MEVRVPKLSMDAVQATFVAWLVDDGATVEDEQPLYTVETDKVETDVLAPASGVLRRGSAVPGTEYPIGTVLGVIEAG
ncbi:biotin-requiring enzyme family protein [Amycolatopsis sp. RM579]|uniref:Biotin-requiring enzyme family protein n=1 Tax=Amycolatopsis pithecellobii TaxID=664692 RepID=A0A6N7Z3G3_9PSEU|nr:biotin-requiring enzyme family protein [Amycolatopsis pithecellobii]